MRLVGLMLVSLIAVATALAVGEVRAPAAQPAKEAVAVGTGGAVASVDPDATRAGVNDRNPEEGACTVIGLPSSASSPLQ
jgi:hypothetical protein